MRFHSLSVVLCFLRSLLFPGCWLLRLLGVLLLINTATAESIWERQSRRSGYLFEDNYARQIGDNLTIRIRESTAVQHNDQRELEKSTKASRNFNFSGTIGSRSAAANMAGNNDSDRSFEGSAQYSAGRTFNDQMTVTVIDVLPNGNLLVEGHRRRIVSGESRTIRVSGIVRPVDIEIGNIVDSPKVANFEITYQGRGAESSFTRQGWLGRMGNRFWPY